MSKSKYERRYPIGAELIGQRETHFRVWAPKAKRLDVVLEGNADEKDRDARVPSPLPAFQRLEKEGDYFSGLPRLERERFIAFVWMKTKAFILIRRRAFNPRDRTVLPA